VEFSMNLSQILVAGTMLVVGVYLTVTFIDAGKTK